MNIFPLLILCYGTMVVVDEFELMNVPIKLGTNLRNSYVEKLIWHLFLARRVQKEEKICQLAVGLRAAQEPERWMYPLYCICKILLMQGVDAPVPVQDEAVAAPMGGTAAATAATATAPQQKVS